MAGINIVANPGEVTTGTSAKTVLQVVAASNHRVKIKRWGITCKGVVPTDPSVLVRLLRQTTAGTMTALTPKKLGDYTETVQTTAQHTATGEPTAGDVLAIREVHPQAGYYEILPFGDEIPIPGGGRVGIEVTATVSISVVPEIVMEE